ncbi:MAG: sugar transferase [Chloroflexi bacterium]|nr:sugar transferase [Chloroflexota bacterium]
MTRTRSHNLLQPGLSMALDFALLLLAVALAFYVRYELRWFREVDPTAQDAQLLDYVPYALLLAVLSVGAFWAGGAYRPRRGASWFDEMGRILNGVTTSVAVLVFITFFLRPLVYSRLLFVYVWLLALLLEGIARAVRRIIEARLRAHGHNVTHVLLVGGGDVGRAVIRQLLARPELGYRLTGFLDDEAPAGNGSAGRGSVSGRLRYLGRPESAEQVLETERVDEVIITLPWAQRHTILRLVRACERRGILVRVVPDLFQLSLSRVDVDDLGGIPLIGIKEATLSRSGRLAKRLLDLTVSGLGLALSGPVFLILVLLIRLDSSGAAIFRQTRVGHAGRRFRIFKFRTMVDGAEQAQAELRAFNEASGPLFKIKDDPRLTRIGRFLRRSSLDELPQLINVLRGEMSLVGPRPALPDEVDKYEPWQRQRLEVAPGLTGLWQVSGRSDLSFEEMCLLDIYYTENWSLALDLSVLLRTVPRVLLGQGAY